MRLFWLNPAAWLGMALLAVPVLVHLLARLQSRKVPFPSLRFLPAARLAALRRRVIENWPLLVVRLLIVAAAVAALAAPVVVSDARRTAWDARVARALVLTHEAAEVEALAREAARGSFSHARFAQPHLADAVSAAAEWLRDQPPASREVVIIGDLREGALSAHDLGVLGPGIGVRFLPAVAAAPAARVAIGAVADMADATAGAFRVDVVLSLADTRAQYTRDASLAMPRVRLLADPAQQAYADAVLRAVWRDGVVFRAGADRAVTLAFEGAAPDAAPVPARPTAAWMQAVLEQHPALRGGEADGQLVARVSMPITDEGAPALVASVLGHAFAPDVAPLEPRRISAATLATWSRAPGPAPLDARPADEGDRRWFWAAALLLLGVERVMRRRVRA